MTGSVLTRRAKRRVAAESHEPAGYRPDPQLSLAMKALTQSAEFMKLLYPPGHASEFSVMAVEMTRDLVSDSVTEERVSDFAKKQATYAAREALQQLSSVEEAANMWLRRARKGRFEVKIDTSDLAPRIDELPAVARTITLGLIVVGLAIASAIAATAPHTGTFKWVRDVGLVVYLVALVLAAAFIVDLISARRDAGGRRTDEVRAAAPPPERANERRCRGPWRPSPRPATSSIRAAGSAPSPTGT